MEATSPRRTGFWAWTGESTVFAKTACGNPRTTRTRMEPNDREFTFEHNSRQNVARPHAYGRAKHVATWRKGPEMKEWRVLLVVDIVWYCRG